MSTISRNSAKLFLFLKKDVVQHIGFGAFVYVIVFSSFAILNATSGSSGKTFQQAFWQIVIEAFLYTLLMGIPVYFNLFFIFKGRIQELTKWRIFSESQQKGWGFYLFLLFSLISALLFGLLLTPILQGDLFEILKNPKWFENVLVISLLILSTAGVSFSKDAIEQNRELERLERRDAIRKRKEAERQLGFIKKQIRPHFLFNVMANLQILAKQKSDKLPDLMGQLSNLLRHLIYRTNEKLVPLEQELEFIKSYVGLQELSLRKNTKLELQIANNLDGNNLIAPMILLSFIENCFKHYNKSEAGEKLIQIDIGKQKDYLTLNTKNTFKINARNEDNFQKKDGGVGQKSAIEHLKLLYKDQYLLKTETKGNIYEVHLEIPLR
jgi:sensor histidine kinase YesM